MSIGKKISIAFAIVVVLLLCIGLVSYYTTARLLEGRRWVEHTQSVLEKLEYAVSLLKDVETGERGYLLVGDEEFLEPTRNALRKIDLNMSELRSLTSDNQIQQERLDKLEKLVTAKMDFGARCISLRDKKGLSAATELVASGRGKRLMDDARRLVDEMQSQERSLLRQRARDAEDLSRTTMLVIASSTLLAFVLVILSAFMLLRDISQSVSKLMAGIERIGDGQLDEPIDLKAGDEFGEMAAAFNEMAVNLKLSADRDAGQNWLKTNLANLNKLLSGQRDLAAVAARIIAEVARLVDAQQGVFYLSGSENGAPRLVLSGTYAYQRRKSLSDSFALGEGLVGQCALEKQRISVTNVPDDYVQITSGLGESKPGQIIVVPALFEGKVMAVMELCSLHHFSDIQIALLDQLAETLGIVLSSIQSSMETEDLLRQSQVMTEELQSQQEELAEQNRRLEQLTATLRASEELLKEQQEELQATNEELEEKSELLGRQNLDLERKNNEVERSRLSLEEKAQQLLLTSKYKSEFLANMSHELRTPLNSLLILSQMLAQNQEGNLTAKQVEFASTIHLAGNDLLGLINDILDLSKIESGTMTVDLDDVALSDLRDQVERSFRQLSRDKKLDFAVSIEENAPRSVHTDARRLQQVLNNLLANAFKFTAEGKVELKIALAGRGWSADHDVLSAAGSVLAFSVSDTGIGIAPEKQAVIFEAFQQADGTTSRKYGGTGLGLAISREIACLLGGEIRLSSEPGAGSCFTLYLPLRYLRSAGSYRQMPGGSLDAAARAASFEQQVKVTAGSALGEEHLPKMLDASKESVGQAGRKLLVVISAEDERARVAELLASGSVKVSAVATAGEAMDALASAKFDCAVIELPALESGGLQLFENIKSNPDLGAMPVIAYTDRSLSEKEETCLRQVSEAIIVRADGFTERLLDEVSVFLHHPAATAETLRKAQPVAVEASPAASTSKPPGNGDHVFSGRTVLVVDDDVRNIFTLTSLLEQHSAGVLYAENGRDAIDMLKKNTSVDLVLMDIMMPEMDGYETMRSIREIDQFKQLPIIALTAKAMRGDREKCMEAGASDYVAKPVDPDQLLSLMRVWLYR